MALLVQDATGKFTGSLYATTGTYFPNPWQGKTSVEAGTATFTPSDAYHATLSYTVNGVGTVIKAVQPQTLTAYMLSGNYSGSGVRRHHQLPQRGSERALVPVALQPGGDADRRPGGDARLHLRRPGAQRAGLHLAGPLTRIGRLYQLNGQSSCTVNGAPTGSAQAVTIDAFHATGHGIEGHVTALEGCQASVHFSAVLNTNN